MRPLTVAVRPLPAHTPLTEPLLDTRPEKPSDVMLPPAMVTTAVVFSGQVRPKLAEAHRPSKLPPPPPPPPPRFAGRSLRDGRSRSRDVERAPPSWSPEIDLS